MVSGAVISHSPTDRCHGALCVLPAVLVRARVSLSAQSQCDRVPRCGSRGRVVPYVVRSAGSRSTGDTGRACHGSLEGGDMQFTPSRFTPIILSAFLALPVLLAAQEPVTITGKVTSDAGQALSQVEVAIPAMGLGALSKDDGGYVVVVPGARVSGQTVTLVARRLGYKSQSAQVTLTSGGVTHDFTLAANPLQLGEVVVTGAGTSTSAEKLGNVRNNVSSDLITKAGETNVVQALAAKAP